MVLAVSHLLDLRADYSTYHLPDPVFPFMVGKQVYGVFSLILVAYAVCCLRAWRDPKLLVDAQVACGVILASLLLYRGSMRILGETECHCLGILGRVLRLTPQSEPVVRWLLFGVLALPLAPLSARLTGMLLNRSVVILCACLALLGASSHELVGADVPNILDITGTWTLTSQDPNTGKPHLNECGRGSFSAKIAGERYNILLADGLTGQMSGVWYDGTTFCYYDFRNGLGGSNAPTYRPASTGLAILKHGNWLVGGPRNHVPVHLLWFMFGASKGSLETVDKQERPLPWGQGRYSLAAYGYGWKCLWLEGSRFLQSAVATRDVGLDLKFTDEITRPTLSFPFPAHLRRDRLLELEGVRLLVPDKVSAGGYEVTGVTNVSGLPFPLRSELIVQAQDGRLSIRTNFYHFPHLVAYANVENIQASLVPLDFTFHPPDSRFVEIGDSRLGEIRDNRYYAGPLYPLQPGEPIRAIDDLRSVADKKNALIYGPLIQWDWREASHKYIWLAYFVVIVTGLMALRIRVIRENNKQITK